MLKNGTPASPATARARSVFPVPGGPTRSTPRGIRAPRLLNFSGYLRNSTTSVSSCFASSTPATSLKVTTVLLPRNMRARLLPKLIAWLLVPCAWRIMKKMNPPIRRTGRRAEISSVRMPPAALGSAAEKFSHSNAPELPVAQPRSAYTLVSSDGTTVVRSVPLTVAVTRWPSWVICRTLPARASSMSWP